MTPLPDPPLDPIAGLIILLTYVAVFFGAAVIGLVPFEFRAWQRERRKRRERVIYPSSRRDFKC